jgi:hypothetical protein
MIDERPDISGLSVVLGLLRRHPVAHVGYLRRVEMLCEGVGSGQQTRSLYLPQ